MYNSIQVSQLIERASAMLEASAEELSEAVNNLISVLEDYRTEHLEALKPKATEVKKLTEAEHKAAIAFLKASDLLKRTGEAITTSGIVGEETNSLIAYLTYTSRKRKTPLHLMCLGASGTGKTWLQERVGELMPEEDKIEITTLSNNAFYYFGKEEFKHKLLLIEDLDGADNVLYPLRELQSKRRISKTVTLKDSKGNMKTVTLNVEGPVGVSGCTTKEQLYEDNANRCILLYMDSSAEQDKRIMDYQKRLSAGLIDSQAESEVREQLKNVQRVLQTITVRNPYATYMQLPNEVFKPRRTMMLLLLFTETITYYHQYHKELKKDPSTGEQYIESTTEDIEHAFTLLETTLLKKSDELNDACRTFFERLKAWLNEYNQESFCSRDIRSALRVAPSSLQRYLYDLERMGYITIGKGTRYKGFEYKVRIGNDMQQIQQRIRDMVNSILENLRSVARNPIVAHSDSGLHNKQKASKKKAVTLFKKYIDA